MRLFRPASPTDLHSIYDLQNIPFREEVFDSSLPPYEEFFSGKKQKMEAGEEHYYVLEGEQQIEGFTWFVKASDFWHATVWSRWIKTLVYASSVAAFDQLGFPRLVFGVRQTNKRMIRVCREFQFRKVGETSAFYVTEKAPYIGIARLNYYDITAEEFRDKSSYMLQQALPVEFK